MFVFCYHVSSKQCYNKTKQLFLRQDIYYKRLLKNKTNKKYVIERPNHNSTITYGIQKKQTKKK